ncbi:glutaminyl-peptide cyclotransferase [Biscogniauxia sp. FL1348]|nr:glutaminyl-peptide cyclotransferase [Biscogniauxia sp. FL1348]
MKPQYIHPSALNTTSRGITGTLQALVAQQFLILSLLLLVIIPSVAGYSTLSDHFLKLVPSGDADYDIHNGRLLAPLLIPRVAGTPGQEAAQRHFVDYFAKELPKWKVEWYNSTSTTPVTGNRELPFANLVLKREPPWVREGQSNLLTLVAHYDSKITPDGFIGATDSAVPCAILMHVARTLDPYLTQMYEEMTALGEGGGSVEEDMGVQILLLDGEEAFLSWTSTDSLYGSRALAEEWENTPHPVLSGYRNPLGQISMFVLLDLLGAAEPRVLSWFQTTHWAYQALAQIETRMRALGLLESSPKKPFLPDADKQQFGDSHYVQDDHVPFMARGVPILHVIPTPFPPAWHKIDDDGDHLDMPTVRDWARIVTAFALEWLDMMEVEPKQEGGGRSARSVEGDASPVM